MVVTNVEEIVERHYVAQSSMAEIVGDGTTLGDVGQLSVECREVVIGVAEVPALVAICQDDSEHLVRHFGVCVVWCGGGVVCWWGGGEVCWWGGVDAE